MIVTVAVWVGVAALKTTAVVRAVSPDVVNTRVSVVVKVAACSAVIVSKK